MLLAGSAMAADIELTETLQLPECHSLGWVRANAGVKGQNGTNIILDEAKWGTPSPGQVIEQHWDWDLSDAQWAEAVKQKGEGKPNIKLPARRTRLEDTGQGGTGTEPV